MLQQESGAAAAAGPLQHLQPEADAWAGPVLQVLRLHRESEAAAAEEQPVAAAVPWEPWEPQGQWARGSEVEDHQGRLPSRAWGWSTAAS